MNSLLRVLIISLLILPISSIGGNLTKIIKRCDISGAKKLIEQKNIDVNISNRSGVTPLHFASSLYSKSCPTDEIVELLLKKKADPNAKTVDGFTPLHISTYKGFYEISKLLLNSGANPNILTNNRYTPLHQLIKSKSIYIKHIELLVDKGADIDAKDENGITPIHLIVGKLDSNQEPLTNELEYLISKKADINIKTIDGITPLEVGIRKSNSSDKYIAYIDILARSGANIEDKYIALAKKKKVKDLLERYKK
jgi:ankyrin repeat protein